ncbi:hypothetical protein [Pelomonas sp. SE-A7]|uniref:hypothetical protein n=1 Tax=Pelomonas sp. SE-A7 TaxID=3054953 RepID=UPI00259CE194|nr:hypothetical protein [Pelomonas sp. SE-A7]MDM4767178.1 hypothetical protein [Pelomonas sp. SE-A7]
MRDARLLLALTAANAVLMLVLLAQNLGVAHAQSTSNVLRGRALELVDDQGRLRASLNVQPAGVTPNGVAFPETVLLRLITERGRPSVKIAASEQAAGLSFAGPTGTRDTYVILESKENASVLRLRNENGSEHVVKP